MDDIRKESMATKIMRDISYEEFVELVLTTGAFEKEIISDYIFDMNIGVENGLVEEGYVVPAIEDILSENGQMHFEMIADAYS